MRTKVIIIVAMALCAVSSAYAQVGSPTLRAAWEMSGPVGPEGGPRPPFTVANAQGYTYKMYKVADAGSGTTLIDVVCTTTADPYTKTCTAPVPAVFNVVGLTLDMTAVIVGIETVHSTSAVVPPVAQPQAAPANFRIIRGVARLLLKGPQALGHKVREVGRW